MGLGPSGVASCFSWQPAGDIAPAHSRLDQGTFPDQVVDRYHVASERVLSIGHRDGNIPGETQDTLGSRQLSIAPKIA